MNWLAHLYLSEPDAEFRIGNLLPDLTSAARLAVLPDSYQRGIRRHHRIDSFTDIHPRFKSCVRRFPPPFRRYGGILTDVYFDHFLARDWPTYSEVPLLHFIGEVYRDIETCLPAILAETRLPLLRMCEENWLASYHSVPGVTDILGRISRRFRRPFDLTGSIPIFQEHESAFADDFRAFFPELTAHVQQDGR